MTLTPAMSDAEHASAAPAGPKPQAAGHVHVHDPAQTHTHARAAPRVAPRLSPSLLRLSLANRLLIVGALLAPLWVAVLVVVG